MHFTTACSDLDSTVQPAIIVLLSSDHKSGMRAGLTHEPAESDKLIELIMHCPTSAAPVVLVTLFDTLARLALAIATQDFCALPQVTI
eukprot:COSAG05_NODE_6349_length_976_cov_1.335234_1_plen_88_part_00